MTSSLPSSPFAAGTKITDPRFFVGRKNELQIMTARMTAVQPISINIVGQRRIGKSSLLYHFFQTYEQRVSAPTRYVVIYLSLQDSRCQRQDGLYQAIAWELWHNQIVMQNAALVEPLRVKPFNRLAFSAAMRQYKRLGVQPVLCLDEFGPLFRHPEQFDNEFFDNLHSLMESGVLMLIVASHRRLNFYQSRHKLRSTFFKLWEVVILGELTQQEAQALVCLPASKITGTIPILTIQEQQLARLWGKGHPYLLQLAAILLYKARQLERDESWAKTEFNKEARRVPKPPWKFTKRTSYSVIFLCFVLIFLAIILVSISLLSPLPIGELLQNVLSK
jgi:uncharacterized protein